jgi:hypothetical protein
MKALDMAAGTWAGMIRNGRQAAELIQSGSGDSL